MRNNGELDYGDKSEKHGKGTKTLYDLEYGKKH
uniref:Uncharacterized protein n=1 Tax=Trichinella nativa TaxID=6335 RepID=A0A0V1IRY9_9BILA